MKNFIDINLSKLNLTYNIFSWLKFIQVLEQVSKQANDLTVLNALGANNGPKVLPTDNSAGRGGYTVFVPINDALNQLPQDVEVIRNDFNNFVVKGSYFIRLEPI